MNVNLFPNLIPELAKIQVLCYFAKGNKFKLINLIYEEESMYPIEIYV